MREDLRAELVRADVPLVEGMSTDHGRVIEAGEEQVIVAGKAGLTSVPVHLPIPDLEDLTTWLLCLAVLASRTGLAPGSGVLWYLSDDGDHAWVLEGTDEVRTRQADTDDPLLALARALVETNEAFLEAEE